jgi:mannosyl-oligosaccharide alpha-1,2-mannosidase
MRLTLRTTSRQHATNDAGVSLGTHDPTMLPTPQSMEYGSRQPVFRRTLFSRAFKSKASRLMTISVTVSFLFLVALWTVKPKRLYSVPLGADPVIPAYRMPEPMFYGDEPDSSNLKYRQKAVKHAFLHAYRAYEENAFPADEYWPLSNKPRQK